MYAKFITMIITYDNGSQGLLTIKNRNIFSDINEYYRIPECW